MRSFPLFLTAAALAVAGASAEDWSNVGKDVTVTATSTRTHLVCPTSQVITCAPESTGTSPGKGQDAWWSKWNSEKSQYGVSDGGHGWPTATRGSGGPHSTKTGSPPTGTAGSGQCSSYSPVVNATDDICNSAADRSAWCDKKDTSTDYYKNDYYTGVTRTYTFEITNTTLVFDGTGPKLALAINGQVPGPVIEANWGDLVQITVINKLQDNSTSIHFHGIRQVGTNDQDGVPGVTECAIAGSGGSRTYTWHASSYGTSWYHSHAFAQYGDGIRGPIVIHGPATANYDYDMGTVMIDDTFDTTAAAVASRIAHFGPGGSFNILFNGQGKNPDGTFPGGSPWSWGVKSCKKHLFRIINSSSQNSYIVGFDSHTMTVISADFVPIVPYETDSLYIANGQRYEVIVAMDQAPSSYYVRAVIQTGCPAGGANSGLGTANAIINYEDVAPTEPVSSTTITAADAAVCQDEPLASLVPFLKKSAGSVGEFQSTVSTLPAGAVSQVTTSDDGTVFQWFLNNGAINVNYTQPTLKTLAEGGADSLISNPVILNAADKWVYFIIQNQFFASHPLHLHGHDMSVLGTGVGAFTADQAGSLEFTNPTRRDTVMLQGSAGPGSPAGYTVVGFQTDNPGAWVMHCHIVWHVDGGLALQFVERPSDIPKSYYGDAFKKECSDLAAYQSKNTASLKLSGSSGLKRAIAPVGPGKRHLDQYRRAHAHRH